MSVIIRSQKDPLGRAPEQTIMIPCRKLYYNDNRIAKKSQPDTPKKTNSMSIIQCPQAVRKFLWQMTSIMFFDLQPSVIAAL